MIPKPIAEAWEDYRRKVLPFHAPAVMLQECRRTFYAGAISLFNAINANLTPDREPQPSDVEYIEAIHAELEAWPGMVERGEA